MGKRAPSSPRHPVPCRGPNCTALVWIKNIRPAHGGKLLRIPLETKPSNAGTVAARPYSGEPGRFLARTEQPEPGEQRWTNHFDHCPDAATFRKPRTTPDPQPALFPITEGTQ